MEDARAQALELFKRASRGQIKEGVRAERAKRRLAEFVRQAWHILHGPEEPLVWNWHLDAICQHLEAVSRGEVLNLLVNIPPGFGKSLIASVFWPAWEWITKPWLTYLCVTGTSKVMLRDAIRCQEVVDSEWYQSSFIRTLPKRKRWTWSKKQDAKTYYLNTAGGGRMSATTNVKITGIRPHRRIGDDLLDADDAYSDKAALSNVNQWYDQTYSTREANSQSAEVMIGQRLHEMDPPGHVLSKEPEQWVVLCLPNEYDGRKNSNQLGYEDPRTVEGELLFPYLCDEIKTARWKIKLGDAGYSAKFQQQPTPEVGNIFLRDWFTRSAWLTSDELPGFDYMVGSWDLNNLKKPKPTTDTDHVCGDLWGIKGGGPDAHRWLLKQYREKIGFDEQIEQIKAQRLAYPLMTHTLIEAKANGPSVIAALVGQIEGIEPINVQGESKVQRGLAITHHAKDGRIHIPDQAVYPWVIKYLDEVCGFPGLRKDDRVDTLTMLNIWVDSYQGSDGMWSHVIGG